MNLVASLVAKDFRRDWKRPWTILLFSALPLLMTALIAAVFGGGTRASTLPALRVAIWDQDKDMISGILRSLPDRRASCRERVCQYV